MPAKERRQALATLVREGSFTKQVELSRALAELTGDAVSQPVLSRDLAHLGIAKVRGSYRFLDEERVTPLAKLASLLRGHARVDALRLVVCEPGAASAVARALEAEELDGVLGSVAGDDTILVALDSEAAAQALEERLDQVLG